MSYSWVFFADFAIPHRRLAALRKQVRPRQAKDEDIRAEGFFFDRLYTGDNLAWRGIFDKSEYAEMVDELEGVCEQVSGQGGVGAAVVIGNIDGPTDRGERIAVSPGKVVRRALTGAERKQALSSAAYQEVQDRLGAAFAPKKALPAKGTGAKGTGAEQAAARLPPSVRAPVLTLLKAIRTAQDEQLKNAIFKVGPLRLVVDGLLCQAEWRTAAELRDGLAKWFRKSDAEPFAHLLRLLGVADPAQAAAIGVKLLRGKAPQKLCRAAAEVVVKSPHAALVLDHLAKLRLRPEIGQTDLEWVDLLAAAKSISTAELARRCLSFGYDEGKGEVPTPALFLASAVLRRDDDRGLSAKLDDIRTARPKRFAPLTRVMEDLLLPARGKPPRFDHFTIYDILAELGIQMYSHAEWLCRAILPPLADDNRENAEAIAFELCVRLDRQYVNAPGGNKVKALLREAPGWRGVFAQICKMKLVEPANVRFIKKAIGL